MIPEYLKTYKAVIRDSTICHTVQTCRMPDKGFLYETQIWVEGEAAPREEWYNDNYNDALMAHAVGFQTCCNLERKGRVWGERYEQH